MNKMLEYNQFLTEKLMPSQFRKYVKEFNRERYDNIFKKSKEKYDGDRNAYRIYLPLIEDSINYNPEKNKIENFLKSKNYTDIDYINGVCRYKDAKNMSRIGKILSKFDENLLKIFNNDSKRKAGDNLIVCISRHPYDIAGADTDRNWTNCMTISSPSESPRLAKKYKELERIKKELEGLDQNDPSYNELENDKIRIKRDIKDRKEQGENVKYIIHDVKEGSLVSYLIKESDRNINNPVAILNIKPFVNEKDKDDIILLADKRMYGNGNQEFKLTVDNFLNSVNKTTSGTFKLHHKLYDDGNNLIKIFSEDDYQKMTNSILKSLKNNLNNVENVLKNLRYEDKMRIFEFLKIYLPEFSILDIVSDLIGKKYAELLIEYWINKDIDKLLRYNIYYICHRGFKDLLTKKILLNYFKNPISDTFLLSEFIDFFSKDELLDIFYSNEYAQSNITYFLNNGKINLDDIINKIGLDNLIKYNIKNLQLSGYFKILPKTALIKYFKNFIPLGRDTDFINIDILDEKDFFSKDELMEIFKNKYLQYKICYYFINKKLDLGDIIKIGLNNIKNNIKKRIFEILFENYDLIKNNENEIKKLIKTNYIIINERNLIINDADYNILLNDESIKLLKSLIK